MKIFLSSTYRELKSIRSRIAQALESAGHPPNRMEIFNSRPELPLEVCLKEVAKSDLVILIIASSYGSIEEESQLSYTHLEFRHALTLNIPILGYIATRGKHKEDDNLKTFISEVTDSITVTPDLTITTIPEHAVAGVLRYISEHGEGRTLFRAFQTSDQYFESLLNADALFNHTHPLMGHEDQLDHMLEFASSDQLILVLSGAGGTGKSRLLLEFATRVNANASPSVRFLAPNIQLSDDAFRELPTIAQCIVIDDAHRQENLDSWIKACLQRGQDTKVVISTRPWGMPVVDLTLSSIPVDKTTKLKELQPLDLELHAPALAKRVLGSQYEHLADQLVATSGGIPLVITVGGMCVRNGEILPALLDRKEEFQTAALDRLIFRVPEQINGVDRNRLLSVIAAVSPFRIDDESTLHIIADFLGVQRSQLSQAISELTTTWSLLTGGYVTRIVPDVLSRYCQMSWMES